MKNLRLNVSQTQNFVCVDMWRFRITTYEFLTRMFHRQRIPIVCADTFWFTNCVLWKFGKTCHECRFFCVPICDVFRTKTYEYLTDMFTIYDLRIFDKTFQNTEFFLCRYVPFYDLRFTNIIIDVQRLWIITTVFVSLRLILSAVRLTNYEYFCILFRNALRPSNFGISD